MAEEDRIVLVSVGVNMFLGPHEIAAGGLTGLAIILERAISVDRALIVLIGNALVVLSTLFFLGKEVFFKTAIGAMLLPVFMGIIPRETVITDRMLSVIVGSVIFGAAVSILYHFNASSGGTAVPPLIFKKYLGLNTSIGLLISDGVVVLLSLFVFNLDAFFYAIFSILITSITMGYMESGMNKKKMVYILSQQHQAITQDILNKINRGVTLVPVIGAYQREETHMLMVTLDAKKYPELLAIVNHHDQGAFMIADTVSHVHGRGFTYESGSV